MKYNNSNHKTFGNKKTKNFKKKYQGRSKLTVPVNRSYAVRGGIQL